MNIIFHHRIGSKDGQYVHIQELIEALDRAGHSVRLVGPEGFAQRSFGGESGIISRLKQLLPGAAYELAELAYNIVDTLRLLRAIRRERPDVIYERYNLYLLSGVIVRRVLGIPLLVEVNAPLYDERSAYGGLSLLRLARWCQRTIWRNADHVFCVTQVLADYVIAAGVERDRISITPNGVDLEQFDSGADREALKQKLGLAGKTVLGFVGFVREWHGLDNIIDLLAQTRESDHLHLVLVGDGPARPDLQAQAERLGIADRLTVTGIVDRQEIPNYIGCFDIALQPHVVAYASPLKLFEYMACGIAIVAPNTANVREILMHEHDGLLVDPDSPQAMRTALQRLFEDEALRSRLARAARDTITKQNLTWAYNAECVVNNANRLTTAVAAS